jgi:hypothetical protein
LQRLQALFPACDQSPGPGLAALNIGTFGLFSASGKNHLLNLKTLRDQSV